MTLEQVFVDTNLFLRYLTNDIPEQADQVEQLLQRAQNGDCRNCLDIGLILKIIP